VRVGCGSSFVLLFFVQFCAVIVFCSVVCLFLFCSVKFSSVLFLFCF